MNKFIFQRFTTKISNYLIFSCLISLGLANPAQAVLQNGSFEDGGFVDTSGTGDGFEFLAGGSTKITGWTVGGVGVDWHDGITFDSPQDGSLLVDLNLNGTPGQTGTLSQTFATNVGETYELSLYLAGAGAVSNGFSPNRSVTVDIAGINQVFSTPASDGTVLTWEEHTLGFTATGASTTLTFSSPDDTGFWGPLLDDVSVTAVPFEFSPGLGLLAVGGVFGISRLRKKAATKIEK